MKNGELVSCKISDKKTSFGVRVIVNNFIYKSGQFSEEKVPNWFVHNRRFWKLKKVQDSEIFPIYFCFLQSKLPVLYTKRMDNKSLSDTKLEQGIVRKIFTRPRSHNCYQRLSKAERKYIEKKAGLKDLEMQVFHLQCEGINFAGISQELSYHLSYCKKIAGRVRSKIEKMLQS